MKPAFLKGESLLAGIRSRGDGGEDKSVSIWWLGQSGFLVKWNGRQILFDPYLSDSLTRKYAQTDKPHTRMTEQVVQPQELTGIEAVTSSHNHTDHLDAETLLPLARANPEMKLVLPAANIAFARERLGEAAPPMIGIDDGETVEVGEELRFTGIAAAHNELDRDEKGRCLYLGFVVSFGPWTFYHSGDTLWHPELTQRLVAHRIDVAFLPINGNRPERRVAGNLNGAEAAALARACNMGCVIPCHYDMFTFNTESPEAFAAACRQLNQNHHVLENGEGMHFDLRP